jgi:GNAT superfamily N-acetyltransferase
MAAAKSPPFTIRIADPDASDAKRCLRLLSAELERRAVASGTGRGELPTARASFLVAYLRGEPIACGAAVHHPQGPSEIDRLWVARPARRIGIGRLLLAELELRALVAGAPTVRARVDRGLHEATTLCRVADYVELPSENGDSPSYRRFEKTL